MSKTVYFKQFNLAYLHTLVLFKKRFYFKQFSLVLVHNLNVKTVLFQAIQFSKSSLFSSIWTIDRTLSGATTPGQSGPGSNIRYKRKSKKNECESITFAWNERLASIYSLHK